MKHILTLSLVVSLSLATTYQACGVNKQQALQALTNSITTTVTNDFSSTTKVSKANNTEQVQQELASYFKTSSNLTLQHIHYTKKNNQICASVNSKEQKNYTKKLLKKALLYQSSILPKDINQKAKKLSQYLNDIKALQQLIPVFLDDTPSIQKDLALLAKKEKEFQDLYDKTIIQASQLIFKSCKKDKEDAIEALSDSIFTTHKKQTNLFSAIGNLFSKKEEDKQTRAIELFKDKIYFSKENNKVCAIIKKEDISNVAQRLYNDLVVFQPNMLSKDPQKRYKEIEKLLKKIEVTNLLMQPFHNIFSPADFAKIASIKKQLEEIKEQTNPQYIAFHIINGSNITIKIDDKIIKNNNKIYLKEGEHTYVVKAKDRCSFQGSFTLDKFETKSIDIDFDEYHYPSVLFITDKEPHIALDGIIIQPNKKTSINKCNEEVVYLAKYANQTKKGTISLQPNKSYQFDLEFLTAQELDIFNNAKTKYFQIQNDEKYSDSLTPKVSKQLLFYVDEKPSYGTLSLSRQGTFVYTPKKGYVGKDSFTYYIEANGEKSPIKVVNITIKPSLMQQAQQQTQTLANDLNQTLNKAKKETKQTLQNVEKKVHNIAQSFDEEKYQKFKAYLQSLNPQTDGEKIKKLAQKYPQYFNKFLEELGK